MRVGVLVDSACDLPKAYIDEKGIELMPITIRVGDELFEDLREPVETLTFYQTHLDKKSEDFAESIPYSVQHIEDLFLKQLVLEYDFVFCMTITGQRSPIHENVRKASVAIISNSPLVRKDAGLPEDFGFSLISSKNIFTGQAVQAAEAINLIHDAQRAMTISEIEWRLRTMADMTHAYLLPADLYHIYKRASKRGEKSVGWGSYMFGSMLDVVPILHCHKDQTVPEAKVRGFENGAKKLFSHVVEHIEKGLRTPIVSVSYGGPLGKLRQLPGFEEMRLIAAEAGVTVLCSLMSTTAAVNVGPGALSVAFSYSENVPMIA